MVAPYQINGRFDASISTDDLEIPLSEADSFVNYPTANMHSYKLDDISIEVERWQFVPDEKEGLAVQYRIKNNSEQEQKLGFNLTGHSDLMPVWLGERTNMLDGQDRAHFDDAKNAWVVKDSLNPWYLVYGIDRSANLNGKESNQFLGNGISNSITSSITLSAGTEEVISLIIAGSLSSEQGALDTYEDIMSNYSRYLVEKNLRYEKLARLSKLTIPDKDLEQAFEWLKYNCDWLVRKVPGIGTAISAGIPDYPWWFGVDSEYSLRGYMAIGQTDVVYQTIRLLDSVFHGCEWQRTYHS